MSEDIIVPLGFFSVVVLIVWFVSYFNFHKRRTIHETIRAAIDKGQEVSPETIQNMSMTTDPRRGDLRKGVVLVAIALAICLMGLINMGNHGLENAEIFLSIAVFPGIIGIAFLALWRFGYDGQTD